MQVPSAFEYAVAHSIDDVLALLKEHGSDAKIMAGGHSLLPMMKLRLATPSTIVDISHLEPVLRYIKADGAGFRVGALATHRDLLEHPDFIARLPLLTDAEHLIADPLVRNMGTVGGSIAHGDPAEDLAAAFVALDGIVSVRGPGGSREIAIDAMYLGPYTLALEDDELVTEIRWSRTPAFSAYLKVERRYGDYAAAAIGVAFDRVDGGLRDVRIGMCGVGSTTLRATNAQNYLEGKAPDVATLKEAAEIASRECDPIDDARGSAEYKRDLVRVLVARAIERALRRNTNGAKHAH